MPGRAEDGEQSHRDENGVEPGDHRGTGDLGVTHHLRDGQRSQGDAGDDFITGWDGDDTITGGAGEDDLRGGFGAGIDGRFDAADIALDEDGEEEDAERIREMIRRRIQNLPRGLRESADGEEVAPPTGEDLVPSATPDDIFQGPLDRDEEQQEEDDSDVPPATR